MDMQGLCIEQGNDVIVTARWPTIANGSGLSSELYYKPDRYTHDSDPSVEVYTSGLIPDPDNPGATMSQFTIPSADNQVPGIFWWRVDALDINGKRRTAAGGPFMVESA